MNSHTRPNFIMLSLSLLATVAAASCATPAPIVRLFPTSNDVVWVSGRASVARDEGGVRVAVAFEHQDGRSLGLRVEVENDTADKLEVDPSAVTFTQCRAMAIETCGPTHRVIDPERMLAALDERQSREQADAANSQAFLGTMVMLSAVGDVASVASGHANRHTGDSTAVAYDVMQGDAAAHNSELASMGVQQQIWSNEALRRSTLFPGRGAAGRVYVPIDLGAQIVWLHVQTGGHTFSFPFRQDVTRLDPQGTGTRTRAARS
jgi:hypothetical protein